MTDGNTPSDDTGGNSDCEYGTDGNLNDYVDSLDPTVSQFLQYPNAWENVNPDVSPHEAFRAMWFGPARDGERVLNQPSDVAKLVRALENQGVTVPDEIPSAAERWFDFNGDRYMHPAAPLLVVINLIAAYGFGRGDPARKPLPEPLASLPYKQLSGIIGVPIAGATLLYYGARAISATVPIWVFALVALAPFVLYIAWYFIRDRV